jgi:hypothetical protein
MKRREFIARLSAFRCPGTACPSLIRQVGEAQTTVAA